MRSEATTINEYIASLPEGRRATVAAVLDRVRASLPSGYEEAFAFGMISWQVPLSVYPDTYNKKPLMYAALGAQKNHIAVYLCNVYGSPELRARFEAGFKAAGKRLDMGGACVRFKELSDLPLDVIAEAVAATPMDVYVAHAKAIHAGTKTGQKKAKAAEAKTAKAAAPKASKPAAAKKTKPAAAKKKSSRAAG